MSVTVRLGKDLEDFLERESKREGTTKSEVVRKCIRDYYHTTKQRKTAWELGEAYFGYEGSGDPEHSTQRKSKIRDKIHAANRRKSTD